MEGGEKEGGERRGGRRRRKRRKTEQDGEVSTFGAESVAELTAPLAFSLHLHLVWRAGANTGAAVHHEVS